MPTIIPPNDSGASTPSATSVSFSPYGAIAASNVQAAINELEDEKVSLTETHYVAATYLTALAFGAMI